MRYGILGDIHGNLSALERVLECLEDEGIDVLISVGDVVGYGAAPSECIAILQERKAVVVKGKGRIPLADPDGFRAFNKQIMDIFKIQVSLHHFLVY